MSQMELSTKVQAELAEAFMLAAKLDGSDPRDALRWCVRAYVARIAGDVGERQRAAVIALREGAAAPGPRTLAEDAGPSVPADAEPSVQRVGDLAPSARRGAAGEVPTSSPPPPTAGVL
jgi:hypothetical protein